MLKIPYFVRIEQLIYSVIPSVAMAGVESGGKTKPHDSETLGTENKGST